MALIVGTNTYNSLESADEYFADRLNSTVWDNASDSNKSKALIMASKRMKNLRWYGCKTEKDQLMDWPRIDTGIYGVESDEVPQIIYEGECEYALTFLKSDQTDAMSSDAYVVSDRIGDSETQYDSSSKISIDPFSYAKEVMSGYFDNSLLLVRS